MAGMDDKTEPATARRRGEARKRGQIAKSTELTSMIVLLGLLLAIHSLLGTTGHVVKTYFQAAFRPIEHPRLTNAAVMLIGAAFSSPWRAPSALCCSWR